MQKGPAIFHGALFLSVSRPEISLHLGDLFMDIVDSLYLEFYGSKNPAFQLTGRTVGNLNTAGWSPNAR